MTPRDNRFWGVAVSLVMLSVFFHMPSCAEGEDAQEIADRRFAVHYRGLQRLGMDNRGEFANPDCVPLWAPNLEYPGGSGTFFLFSGGLWVGAMKDGVPIVSVCTDGDNGTNEYGSLEFATQEDLANEEIGSVGWLEKGTSAETLGEYAEEIACPPNLGYLGIGVHDVDDDGDGLIDEDPAGDISQDYLDNDGDGLIDLDDPDYDGDVVPGSRDDDGDGLIDEDDLAWAGQELITAYVDTCESCMDHADSDGFTPLGIRVVQHSYQWSEPYADDFILVEYAVTNIGNGMLADVALGMFFDFHVGHYNEGCGSEDDITFYVDSLQLAVGADNDFNNGLLSARLFGVCPVATPIDGYRMTYANFNSLHGGDPHDGPAKYQLLVSGNRDPDCFDVNDWRFVLAVGPLGDLEPGETMRVTFAIVNGVEEEDLISHAIQAKNVWDTGVGVPTGPDAPIFMAMAFEHWSVVRWQDNAERSIDPITGKLDFQGYNVWRAAEGDAWVLLATHDLPDTIGLNAGWPPPESVVSEYAYECIDQGLTAGVTYRYVVTAFDDGENGDGIHDEAWDERHGGIGVLESSREGAHEVVPAAAVSDSGEVNQVYVVPNPYWGSSVLERGGEAAKIDFRGLPPVCEIKIYTLAGDFVRELFHTNGLSWERWDLRNEDGREVAGGIYLYRIGSGGKERIGKFVVVR